MTPERVAYSLVVPVGVEQAYSRTLPMPLPLLFRRWYGPLPPIKEVRDQDGPWGTPDQTRTVALVGGATMREQLTETDPPRSFAYRLTDITGALGLLVDHVDGLWAFGSTEAGTEVRWQWTLYPRSALTRPGVVLLGKLWKGYARQALQQLSEQLVAGSGGSKASSPE